MLVSLDVIFHGEESICGEGSKSIKPSISTFYTILSQVSPFPSFGSHNVANYFEELVALASGG
jgi:hypothetical protein